MSWYWGVGFTTDLGFNKGLGYKVNCLVKNSSILTMSTASPFTLLVFSPPPPPFTPPLLLYLPAFMSLQSQTQCLHPSSPVLLHPPFHSALPGTRLRHGTLVENERHRVTYPSGQLAGFVPSARIRLKLFNALARSLTGPAARNKSLQAGASAGLPNNNTLFLFLLSFLAVVVVVVFGRRCQEHVMKHFI